METTNSLTVSGYTFSSLDVGQHIQISGCNEPTFIWKGYAFYFGWPFYLLHLWELRYFWHRINWRGKLRLLSQIHLSDEFPFLTIQKHQFDHSNNGIFIITSVEDDSLTVDIRRANGATKTCVSW